MIRTGFMVLVLALISGCGNKESKDEPEDNGYSFENLSARFNSITPPYKLSDTGLQKNKDTNTLRFREFENFIPDSIRTKIFGKSPSIRYVPLVQMKPTEQTSLFLVKAMTRNKKAAFLIAFQEGEPQAVLPFLVPDNDPTTTQLSSIDASYVITRHISQQKANVPLKEGREVYEYDETSKLFSFILHNPLNIENTEVVNPIDTFSRKHKHAGDYVKDKKNFVSIRDGRHPNQLQVFMHLEKNKGACTGEIKGELLITSPTTAIYRQGGDPCVLSFRFSGSSLIVKEDEGCGAHRGIDCVFDGTYPRKKESKPKSSSKKKKK